MLHANLGAMEPRSWLVELKVGRFEIHSDFDLKDQQILFPELTSLATDVAELLQVDDSQQPVHIVLFQSGSEYRRYMDNYFPNLPQRRAMFIQDRGPGMLFAHLHPDMTTDIRHEITHALLNDGTDPLPLWLDEGLAEYFEVAGPRRFVGNDYLTSVIARSQKGIVPALEHLESIDDLRQFGDEHYRDSWSWVHYFMHRSAETRELLVRYLREHRGGVAQLALSRQLQQTCADCGGDFQAHFRSLQLPSNPTSALRMPSEP